MDSCFFCNQEEGNNYKPEKNIEFVCSKCVQILLRADQEDLKRAYFKAIKHGYQNKAKAVAMFIEKEIKDGKKPEKRRRHFNRKGIVRTLADKTKRIGRHAT